MIKKSKTLPLDGSCWCVYVNTTAKQISEGERIKNSVAEEK